MGKIGSGMRAGSFRGGGRSIGRSSFGKSSFGRSSFGRSSFGRSSFGRSSFGSPIGRTSYKKPSTGGGLFGGSFSSNNHSTSSNRNSYNNHHHHHHHHHRPWWGWGNRYYYGYRRRGLLYYLLDAIFDFDDDYYYNNSHRVTQPYPSAPQVSQESLRRKSKIEEFDREIKSAKNKFEDAIADSIFVMNTKLQAPMILLTIKLLTYMYHHDDGKLDQEEYREINRYINSRSTRLSKNTVKALKEASKNPSEMKDIMECIEQYDIPMKAVAKVLRTVVLYLDHKMKYAKPLKGLYLELSTLA